MGVGYPPHVHHPGNPLYVYAVDSERKAAPATQSPLPSREQRERIVALAKMLNAQARGRLSQADLVFLVAPATEIRVGEMEPALMRAS